MSGLNGNEQTAAIERGFDGISCVGSLLLFLLILFVMGTMLGGSKTSASDNSLSTVSALSQASRPAATQEHTQAASTARATNTPLPSSTPTAALPPTATSTATFPPTATSTATIPPTVTITFTATAVDTATTTATATATNTPTATATATATATPKPLPTPQDNYSQTLKVPILMYHYISVPPEDADVYRVDLSVEPEMFRQQMTFLANNGYQSIDLYDLSLAITGKKELPPKPVVITMDDGYRDNYENAFPILQEFGFEATFFVVTEFVDQNREGYMNWTMLEEMAAAGMRIESHSKTHVELHGQDRDFLIYQLLGSQETIAAHIGYVPRYFSYPSGRYDEATIAVLKELDLWGAVITAGGVCHGFNDRYEWTRVRIRHTTPLSQFAEMVDSGNAVGGKPVGSQQCEEAYFDAGSR